MKQKRTKHIQVFQLCNDSLVPHQTRVQSLKTASIFGVFSPSLNATAHAIFERICIDVDVDNLLRCEAMFAWASMLSTMKTKMCQNVVDLLRDKLLRDEQPLVRGTVGV